jgi:hypothetical protein
VKELNELTVVLKRTINNPNTSRRNVEAAKEALKAVVEMKALEVEEKVELEQAVVDCLF